MTSRTQQGLQTGRPDPDQQTPHQCPPSTEQCNRRQPARPSGSHKETDIHILPLQTVPRPSISLWGLMSTSPPFFLSLRHHPDNQPAPATQPDGKEKTRTNQNRKATKINKCKCIKSYYKNVTVGYGGYEKVLCM